MTPDQMMHIREALNERERNDLLNYLDVQLGQRATARLSGKPHPIMVPTDPGKMAPHDMLARIPDQGFQASLVET
jgi:hypothetical protein